MTNKEKARSLIDQIHIKQESMRNMLHWGYSNEDVRVIVNEIHTLQDELIAMIPENNKPYRFSQKIGTESKNRASL